MIRIRNVRNITRFKRSINAISPVIATLLMIAIAVVASLVVYAWVSGYLGFQTGNTGKAIQVQSYASGPVAGDMDMDVYVQNVGQSDVAIDSIYINDGLVTINSPSDKTIGKGGTKVFNVQLLTAWTPGTEVEIKVTTTSGTFSEVNGRGTSSVSATPSGSNTAPALASIGARTVSEGSLLTFTASAIDSDVPAQTLSFSLQGTVPTGAEITSAGVFTWTPSSTQGSVTPYQITVRVTDNGAGALYDEETIDVTVNDVVGNTAPILLPIGNKNTFELIALTFTANGVDSDVPSQTLTYSLDAGAPSGASINPATGFFAWIPTEAQGTGSSYPITITVTDNGSPALSASETFSVTVNEVNQGPSLAAIPNKTVDELTELTFTAVGTDADLPANTLTYSLTGTTYGATINSNTGVFSWTPTEAQGPGDYNINIQVSDGALTDTKTVHIHVNEVGTAPQSVTLRPSGTGYYDNLDDNWDHHSGWDCLRETTDVHYVFEDRETSYRSETCTMDDMPSGTINSVTVYLRVAKTTPEDGFTVPNPSAVIRLRLGSTDLDGTPISIASTTFTEYSQVFANKPGGTGWTSADINNLQAGVRLQASSAWHQIWFWGHDDYSEARCSQLWIVVSYTPT